jgi:hypothetical protein
MRTAMHPIQRSEYIRPLFSHRETLEITGLTADTLLTWHKRGFLPHLGTRGQAGRGFRRKYTTVDVVYLVLLKHLAGRVPMIAAGLAAAHAVDAVVTAFEMSRYAETVDELQTQAGVSLVVFEDCDGKLRFEVFSDRPNAGVPVWPGGGIQTWMRTAVVEWALVLDVSTIALTVFARIGDVMERQEAKRAAKKS